MDTHLPVSDHMKGTNHPNKLSSEDATLDLYWYILPGTRIAPFEDIEYTSETYFFCASVFL